jgi:DNA (cytosine-5)-methyltransferase 1
VALGFLSLPQGHQSSKGDEGTDMKILNLYAGIGGNRKLWGDTHDITSVEYDENIAAVYADLFPNDTLVVGDAHEYLRQNYDQFDFIWSSPPCQTHSSFRYNIGVRFRGTEAKYPDMTLYEEIVFLQYHAKPETLWLVENVVPYYEPLIAAQKINRHLYWANFDLPELSKVNDNIRGNQIPDLEVLHGYDLSGYKLPNKRQVLRNCVSPVTGREILDVVEDLHGRG